jgi:hypothetical protein
MSTLELDVEMAGEMAEVYSGVRASIMRITPGIAEEMLERNTRNRPLNKAHVRHFREVLQRGDMILNGETIIFDYRGVLLNGQHRLSACVECGVSFDAIVVSGINPEAFKTLDGGKKRSPADALAMQGEVNASNLAAAVQAFVAFVGFGGSIQCSTGAAVKATPQVVDRILLAHPGLRDSVSAMRRSKLYDNQYGYLLHYLFGLVDKRLARDFVECLSGPHEDVGRPFVLLRETLLLIGNRTDLRRHRAAKAIKAFNAERSGARPKMLKFSGSESFPVIDGLDYEALAESVAV